LNDNRCRINHKQRDDNKSIYPQDRRGEIIQLFVSIVIVIDKDSVKKIAEDEYDVEKIDDIRNGINHIPDVEN
jgi:hypothetical protein